MPITTRSRSQSTEREILPRPNTMSTIQEEHIDDEAGPFETPVVQAEQNENLSLKAMLVAIRSELGSMRSELSTTRSEMSIMKNRMDSMLTSASLDTINGPSNRATMGGETESIQRDQQHHQSIPTSLTNAQSHGFQAPAVFTSQSLQQTSSGSTSVFSSQSLLPTSSCIYLNPLPSTSFSSLAQHCPIPPSSTTIIPMSSIQLPRASNECHQTNRELNSRLSIQQHLFSANIAPEDSQNRNIGVINANSRDENQSRNSVLINNQTSINPQLPVVDQGFSNLSFGGARKKLYPLPPFSGKAEDWPLFETSYIDSNLTYNYSHLENTHRLRDALSGSAKEAVEGLLLFPRNVDEIMRKLKFEFGRPDLIVKSQLDKIRKVSPIDEHSIDQHLTQFSNKVANMVTFLQSCESEHHLLNPILLEELICKLPYSKRYEWIQHAHSLQKHTNIVDFSRWLSYVAELNSMLPVDSKKGSKFKSNQVMIAMDENKNDKTYSNEKHYSNTNTNSSDLESQTHKLNSNQSPRFNKSTCSLCEGNHSLHSCEHFRKLSVAERWDHIKLRKLCFCCLSKGHGIFTCRRKKRCLTADCSKFHNTLLHTNSVNNNIKSAEIKTTPNLDYIHSNVHESVESSIGKDSNEQCEKSVMKCDESNIEVLVKIVPIHIHGPRGSLKIYAFIDEGSQITMLNKRIAEKIGLDGDPIVLNLKWIKNKSVQEQSFTCDVKISGITPNSKTLTLSNTKIVEDMNLATQTLNIKELSSRYKYLKGLPVADQSSIIPDLLIGLDNLDLIKPLQSIHGLKHEPSAIKTPLGWVVFGPVTCDSENIKNNCFCVLNTHLVSLSNVCRMVSEYFDNDNLGIEPKSSILESADDVRARNIMLATSKKRGNRFEIGLLWKNDEISLPDSYKMAKSRLLCIERKMNIDRLYAEGYKKAVHAFIDKGYARKLSPEEAKCISDRTWFLPHFGVINLNKPGKIRLVFDARARVEGVSLNDCLLKGPDQYQPLLAILFRFREGRFAVCADIAEMFPQILIRPEDRQAQRFLWRDGNSKNPIEVYEMIAMTFGAKCSPSSAQFIKNLNALTFKDDHPEAVKEIIESHYVDDFVSSFRSEDEAINISISVKNIHANGGFNLRGFISNSKKLCSRLNGDNYTEVNMNIGSELQTEKILGMFWETSSDCFTFKFQYNKINIEVLEKRRFPSKRELLALVMSVFDPFGFVANFLIRAKILLQDVWKIKLNWDDYVSEEIAKRWYSIQSILYEMENMKIPRFYFKPEIVENIQLHCFVDSSEEAMAAVCYLRTLYSNKDVSLTFVCGKTKCCGTKYMSIPRCELQAAVLGSRIMKSILEFHRINISNVFLWTDSRTVLYWVKSDSKKYQQFVSNRISEILENTDKSQWYWVPTKFNPADDGTRAKLALGINDNRWINGPQWLLDVNEWPDQPILKETTTSTLELRKKSNVLVVNSKFQPIIDYTRFSSYTKLIRTFAWVLRFKHNMLFRHNQGKLEETLTSAEIQMAEKRLCCYVQKEYYREEYQCLEMKKPLPRSSTITKHSPYKDEDQILRVAGRLDNCEAIPFAMKRPILLPKSHPFTVLLVVNIHNRLFHQNEDTIICEVQNKFWIDGIRTLVRRIGRDCVICKFLKAKPYQPIMGQLPRDRLTPYVRPFTYCGLDYFGPVSVAIGRRVEKRWIALFMCLTIRAVHMEIAQDLSADSCIVCLRNFMNFRGVPVRIRTDNGTNLVGAKNELIKAKDLYSNIKIKDKMASEGVEWLCNSPLNPCEGGSWERMIRIVKRILNFTLKEKNPKENSLRSLLYEAMNIINSRPLTHIPVESSSAEPLTPNHFLMGCANRIQTPLPDEVNFSLRKQWRIVQQMTTTFWKRWLRESLPLLTRRVKWFGDDIAKKIDKDDVVLICDNMANKNTWERGIVIELIPDKKGVSRKAKIVSGSKILERPVSKLAILDIKSSNL